MKDAECVSFLRWALPRLQLRWRGFRKVRAQVGKRIQRRLRELGLGDAAAYRAYLEGDADEWARLDALCRIPISRFYRDRGVIDRLRDEVLPRLGRHVSCWSAGCASGEEPYTLAILAPSLRIVATDADPHLLERARAGVYRWSSLKELPQQWVQDAFVEGEGGYALLDRYKKEVELSCQDIRKEMPQGPFNLVLCRYLVFTYFEEDLQREVLARIRKRLAPGGVLVTGTHEALPEGAEGFSPLAPCFYSSTGT